MRQGRPLGFHAIFLFLASRQPVYMNVLRRGARFGTCTVAETERVAMTTGAG